MENEREIVFIVDDNPTNLTAGREMLRDYYRVYPVPSAKIMFDLLDDLLPAMILLDIEMPEMNGYEALKRLKANKKWADIPVIFLTAKSDEGSELGGLTLGAIDYVIKPFSAPLLLKRIENHLLMAAQKRELLEYSNNLEALVILKTRQIMDLQNAVLSTVANLVEFRDDDTGGHVMRTQTYLRLLAERLIEKELYADETAGWNMDYLVPSAPLHDVGKIGISDLVLKKPGKLTPEEFELMKTHVAIGVEAIERIEGKTAERTFLKHAHGVVSGHHEKWDGTGYPAGLYGKNIPLEGRIMALADVYDALTSERTYKKAFPPEEAKRIIIEGRGQHFDPVLVDIFLEMEDSFIKTAQAIPN